MYGLHNLGFSFEEDVGGDVGDGNTLDVVSDEHNHFDQWLW